MTLKSILFAGLAAVSFALPAAAGDIMIKDAYARSSGMTAKAGAAFFMIHNMSDQDDRLIGASSGISKIVELHTHKEMGDGVMKMMHVEEGFPIPAGGMHALARGGDHVMFMGLNGAMHQGDVVSVTLVFENAGEIVVDIPVDLERQPADAAMDHSKMDHSKMDHENMDDEKMDHSQMDH